MQAGRGCRGGGSAEGYAVVDAEGLSVADPKRPNRSAPEGGESVLVRVSGRDRPGITAGLLEVLAAADAAVHDMEQVVVRERLTLDVLIAVPEGDDVLKELLFYGWEQDLQLEFEVVEPTSVRADEPRFVVTVIGQGMTASGLGALARAIADSRGNIDRIVRLSREPVTSYELVVVGGELQAMRRALLAASAEHTLDVAVQRESLERRAKRLVLLDMDSTLVQNEVIDLVAEEAGCGDQIAAVTDRAMRGELDFEQALRERVRMLAGLPVDALDRARSKVELTPGARTFVRTLRRLGFIVALVSGGFRRVTEPLAAELGIHHVFANELEVAEGRLTGELVGELVDRPRKAEILREVAAAEGIPVEQTVAIGDGANDLDMLAAAGLGIAFNARPVVAEAADTAVTVPFLDAILFLLGIPREEVERADADDPTVPGDEQGRMPRAG